MAAVSETAVLAAPSKEGGDSPGPQPGPAPHSAPPSPARPSDLPPELPPRPRNLLSLSPRPSHAPAYTGPATHQGITL